MAGRRSQRAVREQTLMFVAGVVLIISGAGLVVSYVQHSDGAQPVRAAADTEVAGITAAIETTTTVAPRSFTLAATGDLLVHSPVNRRAAELASVWGGEYDYRPMFARVKPILTAADLALCHLETPLAPPGGAVRTGDSFEVPTELAVAIADAGYDGCSTASNHALDAGADGIARTIYELTFLNVGQAGTATSAEQAARPRIYDVADARVAHLSYTYGLNGNRVPDGEEYLVNMIDPGRIASDARAARGVGANVVVVSLHWGDEFRRAPTEEQMILAAALAAVPEIDLIVGHHAHVVQPIVRRGELVVAYGLGNFLSNQHESTCCPVESQDGVILEVRFDETGSGTGEFAAAAVTYTATRVLRETFEIVPIATATSDPTFDEGDREVFEESRARTDEAITSLDATAQPSGK
ncbi:MAG: CapA family protein [Actinomycetota bacterium]